MTMMTIPKTPVDITPAWFREHLGWDVTGVQVHEIGAGIGVSSAVYRVHLTGADVPATVVVKLTAIDPNAAFTSTVLRMYIREAKFFNELSHSMPVRVPAGHYGAVSEDGADFVVVMEDLVGNRMLDQTAHLDDADAEACIDNLAVWHANWWNRTDGMCESGLAVGARRSDLPGDPARTVRRRMGEAQRLHRGACHPNRCNRSVPGSAVPSRVCCAS
jgi:hypothetical protein